MKAEERHELQQNDLAGWVYHLPTLLRDYGSYLLFGVALLLLAFNGYRWYQQAQEKKVQDAWSQLADATGPRALNPPAKLDNIIKSYEIRPVQALAFAAKGDFYLDTVNMGAATEGSEVKITPELAAQEAEAAYQKVLADYRDQPIAVVRAQLGLGKVYEARGQWDKAAEMYQEVTKEGSPFAKTAFAPLAQNRLEHFGEWRKPVAFAPVKVPATTQESGVGPATGVGK